MAVALLTLEKRLESERSPQRQLFLLNKIGDHYKKKDKRKFLEISQSVYDLAESLGNKDALIESIKSIANAEFDLGEMANSIESFRRGIQLCGQCGDELSVSIFQREIATPLDSSGKFLEALEFLDQALRIQRRHSALHEIPKTLKKIADVYLSISDWKASLSYVDQVFEMLQIHPDHQLEVTLLNTLGLIYFDMDDSENSLEAHSKELMLSRKIGDRYHEAAAMVNIGKIYGRSNNFDLALKNFETALEILLKEEKMLQAIVCYDNIGHVYLEIGKLEKALEYSKKASELAHAVNHHYYKQMSYLMRGAILNMAGRFLEAITFLQEALTLVESGGSLNDRWSIIYQFSVSYEGLGNPRLALEYHKKYTEARLEYLTERSKNDLKMIENQILGQRFRIEKESLINEVELRRREVNFLGLEALKKNELLLNIQNEAKELYSDLGADRKPMRLFIKKIEEIIDAEKAHKSFEESLTQTNELFLVELKKSFPTLTKMELKICAMLKINMTSYEISKLLFTSERTIEWHRMNIRKKIGLKWNQEIPEFLDEVPFSSV
jgi:tetratricopeptide (TPR) repeat protein